MYARLRHRLIRPAAGVIYLCDPNNPASAFTARSAVGNLPPKPILVMDEAYLTSARRRTWWRAMTYVRARNSLGP
jgi:histidinol-phosphate/aromatic aminotransferase/cobyric acid decarboxylase-like protein